MATFWQNDFAWASCEKALTGREVTNNFADQEI
jgi:hypothetical protein